MKWCLVATLCTLLSVFSADADPAGYILSSDRTFNPDIIGLMTEGGLEDAVRIATLLGQRDDAYAGDIIEYFFHHHNGKRSYESERILSTLLGSLFPVDLDQTVFDARYALNAEALSGLIVSLEQYESPDLRSICLSLAGRSGDPLFFPLLSRRGEDLAARLSHTRGRLTPPEYEEILIFLEMAGRLKLAAFRYPVMEIARHAADRRVVERAREVLRSLH
jgi:hypothetical protein